MPDLSNAFEYSPDKPLTQQQLIASIRHAQIAEIDAVNVYDVVLENLKTNTLIDPNVKERVRRAFEHIGQEERQHDEMLAALLREIDPVQGDTAHSKDVQAIESADPTKLPDGMQELNEEVSG